METTVHLCTMRNYGGTTYTVHRLNVCYNNILRRLLRRPHYCSASGLFAECGIPHCKAVIWSLIYKFITRLNESTNDVILTILPSDIRCTGLIRRYWVKTLYVHHGGLGIFISKKYNFSTIDMNINSQILGAQFIEIANIESNKSLILGNVYLPATQTIYINPLHMKSYVYVRKSSKSQSRNYNRRRFQHWYIKN